MQVIPVIDLKDGSAVHAMGGVRASYRVVYGALGAGADPLALARAFRDRLGLRTLYLADLDAIAGGDPALHLLDRLARLGLEVWCDAGVRTADQADRLLASGVTRVIAALETLRSPDDLADVCRVGAERVVLSLDVRDGSPVAATPTLRASTPDALVVMARSCGIRTVIYLDLDRVGTGRGPPLAALQRLRAAHPEVACLAGGGVRDAGDLGALAELGCAGALVATALHRGVLDRAALDHLDAR